MLVHDTYKSLLELRQQNSLYSALQNIINTTVKVTTRAHLYSQPIVTFLYAYQIISDTVVAEFQYGPQYLVLPLWSASIESELAKMNQECLNGMDS